MQTAAFNQLREMEMKKSMSNKTFTAWMSYGAIAGAAFIGLVFGAQLPHLVPNWSGWMLIPDNAWTGKEPINAWTGEPINKQ